MRDEYQQCSQCNKRASYCITKYDGTTYLDFVCEEHKPERSDSIKSIRELKW